MFELYNDSNFECFGVIQLLKVVAKSMKVWKSETNLH